MSGLPLHLLPVDAQVDFAKMQSKALNGNGVDRHYSGHDNAGLAFRFFVFDEYNQLKSEATKTPSNPYGVQIHDPLEMIEIFIDKKTRCHEKVTDQVRWQYPEEYRRFKDGLEAPGTPLSKWGVVPSHEVATLAKAGIFTVEQLALQNADKIQNAFPKVFFDHFVRAQQFVAAKSGNVHLEETADKLVELQRNYAKMEQRLILMEAERDSILAGSQAREVSKKKVRAKKASKKSPVKLIPKEEDF